MTTVYKRQRSEPLPASATVREIIKPLPAKAKVDGETNLAIWKDADGLRLSAPLTRDGKRVVTKVAKWTDENGNQISAPVTPDGKHVIRIGRIYSAKYKDVSGLWVQKVTGTADRQEAQRIANKWEADARLRAEGVIDARAERASEQGKLSIDSVLDDYIAYLATKNGTEKHRSKTKAYIQEFQVSGEWKTVADIEAGSVTRHAQSLLAGNMAPRTVQARLTAVKGFTRWMVPNHWYTDALAGVKKPNPNADRRVERRMLLPDEWRWLETTTVNGPERQGMTGIERVTLYMLAIQTGLRVNEIASLTQGKLSLDDDQPYVRCKAAGTKNKKPAKQYIDDELADRLREHVRLKTKAAKVFVFEDQLNVASMLRSDLAEARRAWIADAEGKREIRRRIDDDFLTPVNAENEALDFHALRHTCGAWLAIAGVHPKIIQTVMRHGTITLTMDRYGHLFPGQDAGAVHKIAGVMRGEIKPEIGKPRTAERAS